MKHIILINTISFIASFCMGQNIQNTYLDAKLFAAYYTPPQKQVDIAEMLNDYRIQGSLDSNPFFKAMILRPPVLVDKNVKGGIGGESAVIPANEKKITPSSVLGADWQSAVIGGLADFIAERFQSEMVHVGLEQAFHHIRNSADVETIRTLFPKTLKQLDKMYSNAEVNSFYSADLMFLREIIIADLSEMPENVFESELLNKIMMPKEHDLLLVGYYSMKFAKQGFSLQNMMGKLSKQEFKSEDMKANFQIAHLLSESLIQPEGSTTKWVNPILQLDLVSYKPTKEINEVYAYYGLLYEQLKSTKLGAKLAKMKPEVAAQAIQSAAQFVNKLNDAYELASAQEFKFESTQELMEYVLLFTSGIETYLTSPLISVDESLVDLVGKFTRISIPFLERNYQKAIPVMISELADYLSENGEIKYIRSVSFLTQLAISKTNDDIEMVVKAYALPIGGSSIKRHSDFNISVNGYAGFTMGRELAYTAEGRQTKTNIGLTAPIGLTLTWDRYSVFASFFDLGTIVNARVNNDTSSFSNLKLQNFVAPGLGIFYNTPKYPFTFGFYCNYIPALRTVKLENPSTGQSNVDVSRFNLTAVVDIPLYTLFNRDKENSVAKKRKH